MFSPSVGIVFLLFYALIVISIASWVEKKAATGKNIGNNAVIYTFSFAVWLTAWSFYGQVGRASVSGMLFLTSHLGATLSIVLWWIVLRKMVRIRHEYRITSIADLISLRYDKSPAIAALATVIAIVGIVPYLALQLKAVITTFAIIVQSPNAAEPSWAIENVGLIIVGFMILFTILFGVRRLVPTERHQGMVVAMAVESGVKLLAFLAVGIFVTYFLFKGFGDIFAQFALSPVSASLISNPTSTVTFSWISNLLMAMSAVIFVPALFHIMVVENFHENHIRTSMWLFPLFMLLINIFVLPIAMAGLLMGFPAQQADSFMLTLPFSSGQAWLSLFAFIGGFSSAMGMLVINAMTLSTMFTNHIMLPIVEWARPLGFLRRYLLQCRWVAVAAFILASYWFERRVVQSSMLAVIGVYAFAAVLQFAPTIIGGLFWKKGNKKGALLGMSAGFVVWLYVLILPAFVRGGLIAPAFLEQGPLGIGWLRPEHLFGITGLDPASHAVLWTMFFNIGLYVLGSLYFEQTQDERNIAEKFVTALDADTPSAREVSGDAVIDQEDKKRKIEELFCQYFSKTHSAEITKRCFCSLNLAEKSSLCVVELAELHGEVEKSLASSIGAAAAHSAIRKAAIFDPSEEEELKQAYAEIMAELKLPPSDLVTKIDYYREKERLLTAQALELGKTIQDRDNEIMERKRAEEALAEEKERLAVTLRSIGDGVITTDINGKVILINNVAEKLTGWKQEAALGRPLSEVFHIINQKTRQVCENPVETVLRSGGIVGLANHTILISKDGAERIIADSGAPIRDRESRIIGVVLVFRDATEKERLEAEFLKTQKLESVGILAGGIAHDFNNILTAIIGNISLAKKYALPDDKIMERLQDAEKASMRAKDLTRQLLTFSRGGAPIKKIISVAEIIRDSAKFALRGAKVKCEFSIPDELWPADVDEGQISQVIHNMIINADQAMPDGGIIIVSAENRDVTETHNLPLRPGRYIHISIRDTGTGLSPDFFDKIFDPYFTTKQKGSGLGLTSSYTIVKKHDGHISVESIVGKGTTFHVYLPAPDKVSVVTERKAETLHLGRGRVLVMDDEKTVRNVLGEMLKYLGYEVEFAGDGNEALELYKKAKKFSKSFDVVIMDITIPGGMGGKDTIKKLLEMDPKARAIVSSGYSTDPIMADFRSYGFASLVTKPYLIEELSSVLQEAIRR